MYSVEVIVNDNRFFHSIHEAPCRFYGELCTHTVNAVQPASAGAPAVQLSNVIVSVFLEQIEQRRASLQIVLRCVQVEAGSVDTCMRRR